MLHTTFAVFVRVVGVRAPSVSDPAPVNPDSRETGQLADFLGRLPLQGRDDLDGTQRALHDAIVGGERATGPYRVADEQGRLIGPFNALLSAPQLGHAVQQVGAELRFAGSLPPRTRELVICTVAAHWGSAYEWYAHSRIAPLTGVTAEELAAIGTAGASAPLLPGVSPAEAAALRLARSLLHDREVDDATYADAAEHLDRAALVELTVLVGYYQLLAGVLAMADVPAPAEPPPDTTTSPHH